jgi:hypothetical protein
MICSHAQHLQLQQLLLQKSLRLLRAPAAAEVQASCGDPAVAAATAAAAAAAMAMAVAAAAAGAQQRTYCSMHL